MARSDEAERRDLVAHVGRAVDAELVRARAEALAVERSGYRAAVRGRLESAVSRAAEDLDGWTTRHRELLAARQALLDGADWARAADAEVPALLQAREAARAVLEVRQQEHRNALVALDRVLEQRSVAAAAMADAEQKLGDLGVAEMDETKLRRELEASGTAVREAHAQHAQAVNDLGELRRRRAAAEARRAQLTEAVAASALPSSIDTSGVEKVRAALEAWDLVGATANAHAGAAALAQAWADLHADLASVQAQSGPLPAAGALAEAEARVAAASAALAEVDAAGGPGKITADERAELDAAHDAVLAAEERTGRRLGGGSARRELDVARDREAELLARHGFSAYLDVVLTGGRVATQSPERQAAERSFREAVGARDALRAQTKAAPELAYLQGERQKLFTHAVEVLGVDPGDRVVELLDRHRDIPKAIVATLRTSLAAVGIEPVGQSLTEAAAEWLAVQYTALDRHRHLIDDADRLRAEQAGVEGELADIAAQIRAAEAAESGATEALEMATRSVSAFEGELTMRADEDTRRLQRFAAAEQLRTQVQALTETLHRSEEQAREVLTESSQVMAQADTELDRAESAVEDVIRRSRALCAELPDAERPTGEPLATLLPLAAALSVHAVRFDPEIEAAHASIGQAASAHDVAVAAFRAGEYPPGPREEDLLDGFSEALLAWDGPVLVDDPLDAFGADRRATALGVLLEASAARQIVLLTGDADVLGWAIELPSHIGGVLPAAALNLVPQVAEIDTNADKSRDDAAATHRVARS